MIPRYEKKEITQIWSDQTKFNNFFEIEVALLSLLEKKRVIPRGVAAKIKRTAKVNPKRIHEIEEVTRHDIIAFTTSISEQLPEEISKYFHFGVTSSDIIDTALTLQIRDSVALIENSLKEVLKTLLQLGKKYSSTPTMGRSHGIHAEPMSLGVKILGHYCEFYRRYQEIKNFAKNDLTIQLSGSIGNHAIIPPTIEQELAAKLKLKYEPLSTQVIPRDRVAKLLSIHALLAAAIERLAVEIRHLHRTEVGEVIESFKKGQKGSSTMPHKKNPISSENLTGLARVIKSHYHVALENIVLWHERDISHSSAERLILPDNFGLLKYSLDRLNDTLKNLHFNTDVMSERIESGFIYLSSYYLHQIIKSSGKKLTREKIYEIVQAKAFTSKNAKAFKNSIEEELAKSGLTIKLPLLNSKSIKEIYLKNSDAVFKRALKEYPLRF